MQISKLRKRVASLSVLCIFLVTAAYLLREVLEPISYATYFNHDLKSLEENGVKVDLVFVGASRVYMSFVPEVFEEQLGIDCVINAGSSSQPITGTYWQLKDLLERFHPQYVVLGVPWNQLIIEPDLRGTLLVYDRLQGMNKLRFALDCIKGENRLYMLYPYRFRNNLVNAGSIYQSKKALAEADYPPDTSGELYYADKGFCYGQNAFEPGNIEISHPGAFSLDAILEDNLQYLNACVELCKDYGATLSLVTGPTSMMQIYYVENYQDAVEFYSQYAEQHGLVYHNLNFLRRREDFLPDTLMFDYNHVNGEGAYVVSELYAEILKKDLQGIDTSGYFYKDLADLKSDVNRVVAVNANIELKAEGCAHLEILSLQNEGIIPLYQIEMSEGDEETYDVITSWTESSSFDIAVPIGSDYKIKVRAKTGNYEEIEAYQVYNGPSE